MKQLTPIFNVNYKVGRFGFSKKLSGIVSPGISFFQTGGEAKGFVPSHCFYVVNKDIGIEADWNGVVEFPLSKYFSDDYVCVFRKVNESTEAKTKIITDYHYTQLGKRYDYALIVGHFLHSITRIKRFKKWLDNKSIPICSELEAKSILRAYGKIGLLKILEPYELNPWLLFNDFGYNRIFKRWCYSKVKLKELLCGN